MHIESILFFLLPAERLLQLLLRPMIWRSQESGDLVDTVLPASPAFAA
jgi:hypothetical protein